MRLAVAAAVTVVTLSLTACTNTGQQTSAASLPSAEPGGTAATTVPEATGELQSTSPVFDGVRSKNGVEVGALIQKGGPLPVEVFSSPVVSDGAGGYIYNNWTPLIQGDFNSKGHYQLKRIQTASGAEEVVADRGFAPAIELITGRLAFAATKDDSADAYWAESTVMVKSSASEEPVQVLAEKDRMLFPVAWINGSLLVYSDGPEEGTRTWRLLRDGKVIASGDGRAYYVVDQTFPYLLAASKTDGAAIDIVEAASGQIVTGSTGQEYVDAFLAGPSMRDTGAMYLSEGGKLDGKNFLPLAPSAPGMRLGNSVLFPTGAGIMKFTSELKPEKLIPLSIDSVPASTIVTLGGLWITDTGDGLVAYVNLFDSSVLPSQPASPQDYGDSAEFERKMSEQAKLEQAATTDAMLSCSSDGLCKIVHRDALGSSGPMWLGVMAPAQAKVG